MFQDRKDVGRQLADALIAYKDDKNTVIVALPRGGVVPGAVVANKLNLPMELVMVKKIGHPTNDEFAIGAVSMKSRILDEQQQFDQKYIEYETKKVREMLDKRYRLYYGDKPQPDFKGKKVIIIDDGVATGKTLMASIELIRAEDPEKIIAAIPVGPRDTITKLRNYADEVVCLEVRDDFFAISQFYESFPQVPDEEVKAILRNKYK